MSAKATTGNRGRRSAGPTLRQCAVSRTTASPDSLIRFVAGPDGMIVPDLARALPGRGVWVSATREAVLQAAKRNVFSRGLNEPVKVPDDLPELVERLLVRRLTEAVSLANKAGLLVWGFVKVADLVRRGAAVLLIHAADGSAGGAAKLDRQFSALVDSEEAEQRIVRELSGTELDLAIGRSNVVHAAASEGGASLRILQEAARLRRYRSGEPANAADSITGTV